MPNPDGKLRNTDKSGSDPAPFRVGVVPLPGFALMSYACTVEPLRAANLLSRRPLYALSLFGTDGIVESSGPGQVATSHAIGETPPLDLLLVVAGGDPFAFDDPATLDWLRTMAARVPQVGGVSGGSVILAKAGLMAGRRMTVHWEHTALLAERHPDMVIERRLYVIDRDRVTCGGGTAPIDLMHALIAEQHGRVFAQLVSDWFLHTDIRAAGAPQRALAAASSVRAPEPVVEAIEAMENHLADPLTLPQLALMTGVSERHLNRLFGQAFGQSAMEYYRRLRLDMGRRLVTGSGLRIAEIAEATGFATSSHFSNQYTAAFQVRPLAERRAYAAGP